MDDSIGDTRFSELKAHAKALYELLDADERGLSSWWMMVIAEMRAIGLTGGLLREKKDG